jgi:hypothetical protein
MNTKGNHMQDMVKIIKGAEPPNARGARRWPLAAMEVGDSFITDIGDYDKLAGTFHRLKPKRFVRRTMPDPVTGGKVVQVWRVE